MDFNQTVRAFSEIGRMKEELYFLFSNEIADYYIKILKHVETINKNLLNPNSEELINAQNWLKSQIEEKEMRKKFEKYLSLRESGLSR